jgi:hypothetical protein
MIDKVLPTELSAAQLRFAEHKRATPGVRGSADGVFLYRDEPWATYRWLVDTDGRTLEATRFLKTA